MRRIGGIRTFEDASFLKGAARLSVMVALAGGALCALWLVGLGLGCPIAPSIEFAAGGSAPVWRWNLSLFAIVVLSLVAHELVHAIAFRAFAPKGTKVRFGADWRLGLFFACAEGIVYTRRQYLAIALAPSVVVTIALIFAGALLQWPLWGLLASVAHLTGCTGDWAYARAILGDRTITHCEDTSWGVCFYADDGRDSDLDGGDGA
ncbi:MAG: DUF3267 domain-containing protein [Collinsella sp.]|nr:DUF3267 domain-containing protein [Collinsella sp.]